MAERVPGGDGEAREDGLASCVCLVEEWDSGSGIARGAAWERAV